MNTKLTFLLFVILNIALYSISAQASFAQSPTKITEPTSKTTPTPTKEAESESDTTLKSLKEKIESKVEELNKKTKKIINGTITAINDATVTVKTEDNKEFEVTIDDTITKMFTASADGTEDLLQKDLKKGDYIITTGPIIEDQVSANLLYKQAHYLVLQGQITSVDKDAFTVSILTQAKDQYTLDIETSTKQSLLNTKDLSLSKAGFSKYQVGDTIHTVILKPKEGTEKATAIRIVIVPQEFFTSETLSPSKPTAKDK